MESIVVAFIIVGMGLGIPFTFAAFVRDRKHREMMAMIEKGLVDPPKSRENGKGALRWGIVITFLGAALCIGLYPLGVLFGDNNFPLNFGPWMLLGLIPTFFGLSLVTVHYLTAPKEVKETPAKAPVERETLANEE